MADYTTFTEVDPSSHITVTSATRIDYSGLSRSESAYVYLDKGAAFYAGNFTFDVDVVCTSDTGGAGQIAFGYPWGVCNSVENAKAVITNLGQLLTVELQSDTAPVLVVAEYYNGTRYATAIAASLSYATAYYLRIRRDEAVGTYGTLYLDLYSDAARTSLTETKSVTLHALVDFRYLYASNTYNDGAAWAQTGYFENLTSIVPQEYTFSGSGGGISGGAVDYTRLALCSGSGGAVAGGSATYTRIMLHDSTGGGIAGGNADYTFNGGGNYTMDGGGIVGGSADYVRSALFTATGGAVAGGTAPYSFTITSNIQEIMWELYDPTTGDPITGVSGSTTIKFRRTPDGYIYDWADGTFKSSGWSSITSTLSEKDSTNLAGLYVKEIDVATLDDGRYQIFVGYTASTPKQRGSIEFLIKDGAVWDVHTSDNVDVASSTRLASASYTAPDNAGIASISTIVALLRKHAANKMVEVDNGNRTKTFTIYDNDNTTAILTYSYNVDTLTRSKATE